MAITVQMRTEISQLYVALFGRAPDGEGLGFWVQLRDQGMSLADIANTMYATTPARTYYPSFLTNQEIISSFYSNVLGRSADAEGLAFWTNKLNAPGATPGTVIAEMIGIVANYTGTDAAGLESQALFNNRVEVAQYYAEKNGSIAGATTVLAGVTSDDATVAATKTQIDGGTTGGVNQGSTFTFTSAIDNFIGTAGNDKFIADNANPLNPAIQPGDTINGGSGVDIANLYLTGGPASFNSTGVENFFIQAQGGGAFNAQNIAGAEQIWTANSTGALTVSNVQNNVIVGVRGGQTAGGAPVDALTVNFKSGVGGAANTLNVALEAGNVAALSVGDTAGLEDFGTVSIGASQGASTIADVLDGAGNNSQTTKYVFTGDSRVTVNAELEFATTLDASGSTGGARVVIDDTLSVAFTGGTGADRVNVQAAGLTAGDKLDGGEGSDTFRIQSGTMLTTVNAASVKNFEVVNVHADGAGTTYDMDALAANNTLTGLQFTGTNAAGATVNNMTAAQAGATTFAVNDEAQNYTLDVKSFVSGGTGDTASISLDNSLALEGAADGTGVNLGTLTFAKVDVLNIASKSDGTAVAGEFNSIASLSAGDLNKMVITGDQSISIVTAAGTEVTEVDASGLVTAAGVGGATVNIANTAAGGQVLVTGSAAGDIITMSGNASLGDTLRLGGGSDTATLSVNAARDTVEYLAAAVGETDVRAGNTDTYTGFENNGAGLVAADDVIKFTAGVNNALRVGGVNLGATTANVNVGAALSATSNVAAIDDGVNTTLQFDLNGDGAFSATADFAIVLAGVTGATVSYSAANDVFFLN